MARREHGLQRVGDGALRILHGDALAICQHVVWREAAGRPGRGCRRQAADGRAWFAGLHRQRLQQGCARRMVGVGVGAQDVAYVAAGRLEQALHMRGVGRAGIDADVARGGIAHQIAVGAGAGHHAGVGCRQAQQVLAQGHGALALPVQRVQDLAVRADHFQLAEGGLVLHVAGFLAIEKAGARAALPQRLLALQGGEHGIGAREAAEPVQRADGGEDHGEAARAVALQRFLRAHPDGLELFRPVGVGFLIFGHARHEEGHIEAPGLVAVGRPVGQVPQRIHGQAQAACLALGHQRRLAVQRGQLGGRYRPALGVVGQQNAQFLEGLAQAGDGLGDAQPVAGLGRAGAGAGMGGLGRVLGLDAAAREDIGAGHEAGLGRAPCHEHFQSAAIGAVAHQQNGGGLERVYGLALGVQELAGAGHGGIMRIGPPAAVAQETQVLLRGMAPDCAMRLPCRG